jgi:membrane associated rhomboid family serine protease
MFPLKDSEETTKIPFITWILIAINALVFIYQLAQSNINLFIYQYGLVPQFIDFGDVTTLWPFFTNIFMHGGFMHILSNMWYLAVFGDNVEDKLGHWKFLGFYLVAGFVASFAQYIFETDSLIPMVGASGAIAGVLGYYFICFPDATVKTLFVWFYRISVSEVSAKWLLGFWGVMQLFNSVGSFANFADDGVAYLAHLGGFVFGVVVALILRNREKSGGVSGFRDGGWEKVG